MNTHILDILIENLQYKEAISLATNHLTHHDDSAVREKLVQIYDEFGLFADAYTQTQYLLTNTLRMDNTKANALESYQEDLYARIAPSMVNSTKIDADDVTFIIPYSQDVEERLRNLILCTRALSESCSARIIVFEQNTQQIKQSDLPENIELHRETCGTTHYLHKTKIMNTASELAKTPIVCFLDSDILITKLQISRSIHEIKNKNHDVCIAYNGKVIDYHHPREDMDPFIRPETLDIRSSRFEMKFNLAYGGAVFFKTECFRKYNGFNEHFIGWGFEDNEVIRRFVNLGCFVTRAPGPTLHISHGRSQPKPFDERVKQRNFKMYLEMKDLTREETIKYTQKSTKRNFYTNEEIESI